MLAASAAACPGVPDIGADELAPGVDCSPAQPVDPTTPPATTVPAVPATRLVTDPPRRVRATGRRTTVRVRFTGEHAARFECSVDGAAPQARASPLTLRVRPGRHVLTVRAVGATGLVDPAPLTLRFRVRPRGGGSQQ